MCDTNVFPLSQAIVVDIATSSSPAAPTNVLVIAVITSFVVAGVTSCV